LSCHIKFYRWLSPGKWAEVSKNSSVDYLNTNYLDIGINIYAKYQE